MSIAQGMGEITANRAADFRARVVAADVWQLEAANRQILRKYDFAR